MTSTGNNDDSEKLPSEPQPESESTRELAPGDPLSGLPAVTRQSVVRAQLKEHPEILADPSIQALFFKSHRGPLPAPEDFAKYDKTVTGAAERILVMAENNNQSNIELAKLEAQFNIEGQRKGFDEIRRGQVFGFALASIAMGCSTALIATGHEVSGATLFGVTLGSIVLALRGRDLFKSKKSDEQSES